MIGFHCPKCRSSNVECVGWYVVQIALDDAVDISQMLCLACGYEWEL